MMRSKPYRNDRIISVVSALYFSGGPSSSFASRYHDYFPVSDGRSEMPIAMVCLVGTAVSLSCT
jgi:hypothetical protein